MKHILLYAPIFDFTAEKFISEMNAINYDEEVMVHLNSPGGSVFAGWGMIAAITDRKAKTILRIEGNASSMAAVLIPFFDEVQALDVSRIMIHKPYGNAETDDEKALIQGISKDLRDKLKAKIDLNAFKELKGADFFDVFDGKDAKDTWLTGKEARTIKLVDKIVRLDPKEIKAITNTIAAYSDVFSAEAEYTTQGSDEKKAEIININSNKKNMTKETLRAENPAVYDEILALGIAQEQTRVKAWMAYQEIDPVAVSKGISEGAQVDVAVMAAMQVASFKKKEIIATKEESVDVVETAIENTEKTTEQIEAEKMQAEVFASLGIKSEGGLK